MAKKQKVGKEPRKKWDWLEGGGERAIEATGEYPIMYIALGSKPKIAHPFNLYRDIMSIPKAVGDTLKTIPDSINEVADYIVKHRITRIIGTGLGTSQFVAMGVAQALGNLAGWDGDSVDSGEFIYSKRNWDLKNSAFIIFSGSGRTFDANRAAEKARKQGAYLVAVTSVPFSPLTKIANSTIVCKGGFDTGGSDTFHYATRMAAGVLLAIELGKRVSPKRCNYDKLMEQLYSVPSWLEKNAKSIDARARTIAKQFKDARCFITVGGGPTWRPRRSSRSSLTRWPTSPARPCARTGTSTARSA